MADWFFDHIFGITFVVLCCVMSSIGIFLVGAFLAYKDGSIPDDFSNESQATK